MLNSDKRLVLTCDITYILGSQNTPCGTTRLEFMGV